MDAHAAVADVVREVLPDAEPVRAHGMDGWRVRLADPPPAETWRGTFDREHLHLFVAPRKTGTTLHVWHPGTPDLLARNEAWLAEAGFKVMVGCLRWNRKAPLPVDAVRRLLEAARDA